MSNSALLTRLKNRIDHIAPVLYQTSAFTVKDVDGVSKDDLDVLKATLRLMHNEGVIEIVGEKYYPEPKRYLKKWQWVAYQQELQQYYEERNELPCGCRAHIPPETDSDGRYVCKFCEDTHSTEIIKNAL